MADDKQGWQIKSHKLIFDSQWIKLGEYDTIAPTGKPAAYGLVSFKNRAVGVLPIEDDGTTYIVGQYRFPFGRYSWEVPEGGAPLKDNPLDGAKRELSEEINKQAAYWMPLFEDIQMSNSTTDEIALSYIAWGLSECSAHELDDTENLQIRRIPFGELVRMVVEGEISDMFTLAIVMKADHLWRTGKLPDALMRAFDAGQIG